MVLASALYSSGGGGKSILIPNGQITTAPVSVPIQLIKSDNNFSSSGNFTLEDLFTYCNNFTINTSHQMTVPASALRIIYAGGTVTIGGNGITATTTAGGAGGTSTTNGGNASVPNHWHFIQNFASTGGISGNPNSATAGSGFGAGGGSYNGNGLGAGTSFIGSTSGAGGVNGAGGGGTASGSGYSGTGGSAINGVSGGASKFITLIIIANAITITANIDFAGSVGNNGTNVAGAGTATGGSGGGCGSNLLLFANTITHSGGTINVSGGNGGNGIGSAATPALGSGGGGGGHTGLLFMQGTTLSLSGGTRTATAGTGGTGGGSGATAGGAGSAGYAQTIRTITGNPF